MPPLYHKATVRVAGLLVKFYIGETICVEESVQINVLAAEPCFPMT